MLLLNMLLIKRPCTPYASQRIYKTKEEEDFIQKRIEQQLLLSGLKVIGMKTPAVILVL